MEAFSLEGTRLPQRKTQIQRSGIGTIPSTLIQIIHFYAQVWSSLHTNHTLLCTGVVVPSYKSYTSYRCVVPSYKSYTSCRCVVLEPFLVLQSRFGDKIKRTYLEFEWFVPKTTAGPFWGQQNYMDLSGLSPE